MEVLDSSASGARSSLNLRTSTSASGKVSENYNST